jgi:hypothetical protein
VVVAAHDPLVGHTAPGMRATTSRAGTMFQSNASFRCTVAGPGPTRYVIGSAPRHDSGAVGPRSAASSGRASPYEIGRTGILVIVAASDRSIRFAPSTAPTPGREGVAGVDRHVGHAAALDALRGPIRAGGVDLALEVAVVLRVGVDDAADGALLRGDLRLDAAPASAVARDDDLALHVDAEPLEALVVVRARRS